MKDDNYYPRDVIIPEVPLERGPFVAPQREVPIYLRPEPQVIEACTRCCRFQGSCSCPPPIRGLNKAFISDDNPLFKQIY
jgi:hypothetical protein